MPDACLELETGAAVAAGYASFVPETCLVAPYEPGARLSLHQDEDERDLGQPVVSVALG